MMGGREGRGSDIWRRGKMKRLNVNSAGRRRRRREYLRQQVRKVFFPGKRVSKVVWGERPGGTIADEASSLLVPPPLHRGKRVRRC